MKTLVFNLLFLSFVLSAPAQVHRRYKNKFMRKLQRVVWTAGIGGVVIDDDGRPFKQLFNVRDTWSSVYVPSKASFEGFIAKGWSGEIAFTYSQLKAGKIVDNYNRRRESDVNLFALDFNGKYDLNELIGDTKAFSPYGIAGLGYTRRNNPTHKNGFMGNIGLGFNLWFYKGFGFNVQSMAKFAINRKHSSNYLMHSLGIVYRFNLITGYKTPGRLGHRYNLFRN